MSVRVDKTGQNDLSCAIDLADLFAILSDPRIAQCVFGAAGSNDLSARAQDRSVLDNAEFLQLRTAPWARSSRRRSQSQQLADVHQQQWTIVWNFVLGGSSH
jgi:hypothetical protein